MEAQRNRVFDYHVRVFKFIRLRWAGHIARMEEGMSAFKMLTGKLKGKIPLGRPKHRLEGNIRMDLKEMDIITRNWVESVQDRDYECGIVPLGFISHGVSYIG